MEQELLKRIFLALYKKLCAGRLLLIVPALPWERTAIQQLLHCMDYFGWQVDISLGPGVQIVQTLTGKIILQDDRVDLSSYQRIWVPAVPLDVLGRLQSLCPGNRQETMILEALIGAIPVGVADCSWMAPEFRRTERNQNMGNDLYQKVADITGKLSSWGIHWIPEEDSGSWILGAEMETDECQWHENVLHSSAVRMLNSRIRVLHIKKGTVITATARDELARLQIRLIGER